MGMVTQYTFAILGKATPWLMGAAVALLLLWIVLLISEKNSLAKESQSFRSLGPLHKYLIVCAVCFIALRGGSKEGGFLPAVLVNDIASAVSRLTGTAQLRMLPDAVSTNALAITAFEIDHTNRTAYFETCWATNLFDYTDSRNLYLFSSTNLLERKWTPLCTIPMPTDTNPHAFAVSQSDVIPSMRNWFADTFEGVGFYRFGIDFDSDGDGIADDVEALWMLTSPDNADTDGDGLADGLEAVTGTNPAAADTDRDGLSDSFEIETGTDPTLSDTDHDELPDRFEYGRNTDPMQPDSDFDGMNDGWEFEFIGSGPGFKPDVNNETDDDPDNDANADVDGDGLSNGEESEWGTIPIRKDSDADGVSDGAEIGQNSDPADSTDDGLPNSRIPVTLTFGDPSGSCSEKYRFDITPVSGIGKKPASIFRLNKNYGACESKTVMLKAGWKYEVRLCHAGTNGSGTDYPDYDYELNCESNSLPSNVMVDDPASLFGTDYTSYSFAGAGKVATITVYAVTGVTICKPDDSSWAELEESRVVLDDEELRIKIEIAPQLQSLAQCRQAFGDTLTVRTTGTCPAGASVPIGDDAVLVNSADKSEIRITKTRQQLISLGLLPSNNDDGVNEMAVYDVGTQSGSNGSDLSDSNAFMELGMAERGVATGDPSLTLESTPPMAHLSETFLKAAGCEIITVSYFKIESGCRQIMNQADILYYSGHGLHKLALMDDYSPSAFSGRWNKDLDCLIVSGCSILDINDYNNNFILDPEDHAASPGKLWEAVGPNVMLGYNYYAPADEGGAPARIIRTWANNRGTLGDVNAWMKANADNRAWNACAIVKGQKYVYFKRKWLRHVVEQKQKGDW